MTINTQDSFFFGSKTTTRITVQLTHYRELTVAEHDVY